MKNLETILEENNIITITKRYPSYSDRKEILLKNPGKELWNNLSSITKSEIYEQFFKQFFVDVENKVKEAFLNKTEHEHELILNEKYSFSINCHHFPRFEISESKYIHLNSRKLYDSIEEKPNNINFNLKNTKKLKEKIESFCQWIDRKQDWERIEKEKEEKELSEQKNFKTSTKKLLKSTFPKDQHFKLLTYIKNSKSKDIFSIRIDESKMSLDLEIDNDNLTNEQKLKIAQYIKEIAG